MVHPVDDFEDLFEHAPCGYLSADASGRITKVNSTFVAWTGHLGNLLVGRRFQELLNIGGRIYYETHFAPLLRMQGFFNEVALDIVKADGTTLPVLVNAVERRDPDGGVLFVRISVFNATDRRRYERDLLEARRAAETASAALGELAATLETRVEERTRERNRAWRMSQDLLVMAETNGTLTAVNAAWTTWLGRGERELVGSTFMEFTHPDDLQATLSAFGGILDGPLTTPYEYRLRHKDGTYRWFAWTAAFEDGLVYANGRHTTAEREQRAALEQAEQQLRQAQKMEAIGQLTGGIAHDFNNLLTGITGSLELMRNRISQGRVGDIDRYMTVAQGAAKRAAALTHRLLAFARRQTLDPKPTNVNRLVLEMEELIRRTIGPQIALEVVGAASAWPALIDPGQLENALLNLCINARDAMPRGGRITVETANKWLDEAAARQHDMPPGQYLSVCVTDTGTGMSPEIVARVFEPFFTTKPIGEGTGLGLSMVHGFARQSGGQVRIYSEVDEGTTVCLYLPRHYGQMDDDGVVQRIAAVKRAGSGETVLIVDDEPSIRMLVTEVVEEMGYTALEAGDSVAGLKVLQSDVRIELLITDIGLPGGMNGRQMAEAGRAKRPDLRVLFITGFAENSLMNHGQLDRSVQVLTKPFSIETLASRVRELVTVE